MFRLRSLSVGLGVLALAGTLRAESVQFLLEREGSLVHGGEVCFFAGAGDDHPADLYFFSSDVRCLPSDPVLDWAPGLLHFFATHEASGLTSNHRGYKVDTGPLSGSGYQELGVNLVPSCTVRETDTEVLEGDAYLALWFSDTPDSLSSIRPISPVSGQTPVPASTPFLPIVVQGGLPVAVGAPRQCSAGEMYELSARTVRDESTRTLVAWVRTARREILALDTIPLPPEIVLVDHEGREIATEFPLGAAASAGLTLQIFRNVPAGIVSVRTSGMLWAKHEIQVDMSAADGTVLMDEPLTLVPAGSIRLSWAVPASPAPCSDAEAAIEPEADLAIAVARCDQSGCIELDGARVTGESGEIAFGSLPEGTLLVGLEGRGFRLTRQFESRPGVVTSVSLEPDTFRISGSVTKAGSPVEAVVRFETGVAHSDAFTGAYDVSLPADPKRNLIFVEPCGTGKRYAHILDRDPVPNDVIDIELPGRALHVLVTDPDGTALEGASAMFWVTKGPNRKGNYYASEPVTTGHDGVAVLENVPGNRHIKACAGAKGFRDGCSEVFLTAERSERLDETIELEHQDESYGRVLFHETGGGGELWFVNADGTTEFVEVSADGSFVVGTDLANGSRGVVFLGAGRAMFAGRLRTAEDGSLLVEEPSSDPAIVRVEVGASFNGDYLAGLVLDGVLIPASALAAHQSLHGVGRTNVSSASALQIPGLRFGSAQIILGPDIHDPVLRRHPDPFVAPQLLAVYPRAAVAGDGVARFR